MKRIFRWLLILVGGLAGLIALALVFIYISSNGRISKTYKITPAELKLKVSSVSVKRGRHLAQAIGKCSDCHGDDLGGKTMVDDPVFGRLAAGNLTSGKGDIKEKAGGGKRGPEGAFRTEDLVEIIRFGINPETNKSVIFMPSHEFYFLTDQDLADIIAYIKTVPPVDRELPKTRIGPLARLMLLQNSLAILPAELIDRHERRPAPKPLATKAYGSYLATVGGCLGCHRKDLSGGPIPGTPPGTPKASNLTPGGDLSKWSQADFFTAMRRGLQPSGTKINPFMPWKATRKMTDLEIRAVWLYLKSVPAKKTN